VGMSVTQRAILAAVATFLAILIGFAALLLFTGKPDHSGAQQCTQFIEMACARYANDFGGWYPVSREGEIQSLNILVREGLEPSFFATYGTACQQVQYFKEHGSLSAEVSPHRYVRGLKQDDPKDLVVMYRASPTRWTTHFAASHREGWLAMGVDHMGHWGSEGLLTAEELARRLRKTLEFLRDNKRPCWEATLKEHEGFLAHLESLCNKQ